MSSEFGEFGKDSQRQDRGPENTEDSAPQATFWTSVQTVLV